jgi:hypothetical protein
MWRIAHSVTEHLDFLSQRHRQLVVSGQLNLSQRQWELKELLPTHTADLSPNLKFLGPGSSMLGSSDMIAAEMEEVVDLIVGGEEPLRLAADLNCFTCRSRRRVGWCEFSALLLSPLCWRCSMPDVNSRLAAT